MLDPTPTRRDPRVLALVFRSSEVAYAALDAWEVVGLGTVGLKGRGTPSLALTRLVLRLRPSFIVYALQADARPIVPLLLELASRRGLPLHPLAPRGLARLLRRAPSLRALGRAYGELSALAATVPATALRLAAAALVRLTPSPPRRYAARQPSPPSA